MKARGGLSPTLRIMARVHSRTGGGSERRGEEAAVDDTGLKDFGAPAATTATNCAKLGDARKGNVEIIGQGASSLGRLRGEAPADESQALKSR